VGDKKSELMLTKRARAYSSFYSQVILIYFYLLRRNLLFRSQKSGKNHQNPLFWGPRSFKVINVDTSKKHAISACYDKQHVCVLCSYTQPFSR